MSLPRFWVIVATVVQFSDIVFSQQAVENSNGTGEAISCGYSNPGALVFRFQEEQDKPFTDYGEYPWMVAILKKSDAPSKEWQQKDYVGAGSIIHPSAVLTTAHWISELKPDEIKARGGEWDTSTEYELYLHQERNVRKIVKHPSFSSDSLANDVALLFLEKPFDLKDAPHIATVCIEKNQPAAGSKCHGTAWGLGVDNTSDILKKIKVDVLSREDCEEKIRKTRLGDTFQLDESFLCASSNDSCEGDTGAALVCPIADQSSRLALNGMSSYRISEEGAPCLYVSAPSFHKWVGEAFTKEGLDSSSYTY